MLSALQVYLGKNLFELGKKNLNLALGMGPYFGPMRALEKGLNGDRDTNVKLYTTMLMNGAY